MQVFTLQDLGYPLPPPPAFRASRPAISDLCQFLLLRSDLALSNEQFAHAVIGMPIFETKLQLAARILACGWPAALIDDAMQEAAWNVYSYLSANRAEEFCGTTNDAFGAWLYRLILQHARWAVAKIVRGERRRKRREKLASPRELEQSFDAFLFRDILHQLLAIAKTFPMPLSTVASDWLLNVSAKDTARSCQLSERRIFELRHTVLKKFKKALDDMC